MRRRKRTERTVAPVSHEETLEHGHGDLRAFHGGGEVSRALDFLRVELEEHAPALVGVGVPDEPQQVRSPRSDEGGVEPVEVVGGHEDHPLLPRRHAVKRVEQTRVRHIGPRLGGVRGVPLVERRVHVLQQREGSRRHVAQSVHEPVVGEAGLAQVHEAHVEAELARQRRDERGLPRSRGPVQEVAPPVWDAAVHVPLPRLGELYEVGA
mmetsp:Transcript_69399/g.156820  ORF Transcript_69399/g.156820 Transcript_69399/m.156820 type:complete len:209 (+) Transcript_69399:159-785(+)